MILEIDQQANQIDISYIGDDGNKKMMILPIAQYRQWEITTGVGTPGFLDVSGKPVVSKWAKQYGRFELLQFLLSQPDNIKNELFAYREANMLSIDIETAIGDRFATADTAEQPILSIAITDTMFNMVVYTTLDASTKKAEIDAIIKEHIGHLIPPHINIDVKVLQFTSEYDMLYQFQFNIVKNAAMVAYWNGKGFDEPYIANRCFKLGIPMEVGSMTGKVSSRTGKAKHTVVVDYMELTKKHGQSIRNMESAKLDYIAFRVLNVGKLPYRGTLKEMYTNDVGGYLAYNVIDTLLVQLIHKNLNLLSVLYGFSNVCKLPLEQADSQVAQTESLLSLDTIEFLNSIEQKRLAWLASYNLTPETYTGNYTEFDPNSWVTYVNATNPWKLPRRPFEGGFVKEPVKNLVKYAGCIDFSGLYPSCMRTYNMSIENYIGSLENYETDVQKQLLESKDHVVSCCNHVYKNDKDYSYKRIQIELRRQRDVHKKIQHQYLGIQQPFIEQALFERGLWGDKSICEPIDSLPFDIEAGGTMYHIDLTKLNEKNDKGDYIHDIAFIWHIFHTNLRIGLYNGNMQTAYKLVSNSLYGATSNEYNRYANIDVAEDITAEGRNGILCAQEIINNYLNFEWHKDKAAHDFLINYFGADKFLFTKNTVLNNISDSIDDNKYASKLLNYDRTVTSGDLHQLDFADRIMYIDTDSLYVAYEDMMLSLGFIGDKVEFFNVFYEKYYSKIVNQRLADMANSRGGKSILKFDLEYIVDTAVFTKKKKYLFAMAMEDGRRYDIPHKHIKVKGMDLAQNFLSSKCREMIKHQIEMMLSGEMATKADYIKNMLLCWQEFQTFSIEDICKRQNIKKDAYESHILGDTKDHLEYGLRTLPQYRGAMYHNYWIDVLNIRETNELIMDGSVCVYEDSYGNPFSFRLFNQPDFAPEPSKIIMFNKLIVNPVNRIAYCYDIVEPNLPIDESYRSVPDKETMVKLLTENDYVSIPRHIDAEYKLVKKVPFLVKEAYDTDYWLKSKWLTNGADYEKVAMPIDVAYRQCLRLQVILSDEEKAKILEELENTEDIEETED